MRLKDRVTVVTGAASGMGRALCPLLAAEGARLILLDLDDGRLQSLAAELAADGTPCHTAAVDVSDRKAVQQAIEEAAAETGPVDLLVACAGLTGVTLVDDLDVDLQERLARVNFLGVVYCIDAVLPEMLQRRRGQIVALSSMAALRGMPYSAGYGASKVALSRFLESIRPPLRKRRISVTTVYPGFVATPLMEHSQLQPNTKMMSPEDAARHILRAIHRRSRVYYFPLLFSLGIRYLQWLPPKLFDAMMARWAAKIPNLKY